MIPPDLIYKIEIRQGADSNGFPLWEAQLYVYDQTECWWNKKGPSRIHDSDSIAALMVKQFLEPDYEEPEWGPWTVFENARPYCRQQGRSA